MSIQKEDVYETEEYPSPEPIENEEKFADADIEKIHVDIDGAMKLFGNRILNADDVDFSDSWHKKKRKGYRSGNYVLEIFGTENRELETTAQKFQRLRFELEELTTQVEKESSHQELEKSSSVSKSDLEMLNNLLKAALLKNESLQNKTQENSCKENEEESNLELDLKGDVENLKWQSLEERIQRIETTVKGINFVGTNNEPLVQIIENLRLQVDSLNPIYLDSIKNQLNGAITKLAEYENKRKNYFTEELEEKVNNLYKLVKRWDTTCTNIPTIVKRLHSLSQLHEQAQEFATKINDLMVLKEHMEKKTENHKVMLFELKRESTEIISKLTTKFENLKDEKN